MASSTPVRLTRRAGMKFAFTLALAFAVLSVLAAWRGRTLTAEVTFALGAFMLLLGLLFPTRLGGLERAWMGLGHAIGKVTGPIVLSVIYYVALTPIGVLRRTFGRSPLARQPQADSFWIRRSPTDAEQRRRALERQF